MLTFKGHFDGTSIVLDEAASLTVGQAVQVIVDMTPEAVDKSLPTLAGFAKGTFAMSDDFDDPLDEFEEYR